MRIAIATDHAGFILKAPIAARLAELGHEVVDFGTDSEEAIDYPLVIAPAARAVARGECDLGIVLGGSGTGEQIVANKVRGIRCAEGIDPVSARLAREPLLAREPGSGSRSTMERLFREHGLEPTIRMELASNEAIGEAIRCGMGISILPGQAVGYDMQPGLISLDVTGFPLDAHWHVVYPAGKQLPVVAQSFVDFLRKQVAAPA